MGRPIIAFATLTNLINMHPYSCVKIKKIYIYISLHSTCQEGRGRLPPYAPRSATQCCQLWVVTWCCWSGCSHMLWLVIVSLGLLGLGFGTLVVTFHVVAQATMCVIFIHTLHTVRPILMFFVRAYMISWTSRPFYACILLIVFKPPHQKYISSWVLGLARKTDSHISPIFG